MGEVSHAVTVCWVTLGFAPPCALWRGRRGGGGLAWVNGFWWFPVDSNRLRWMLMDGGVASAPSFYGRGRHGQKSQSRNREPLEGCQRTTVGFSRSGSSQIGSTHHARLQILIHDHEFPALRASFPR